MGDRQVGSRIPLFRNPKPQTLYSLEKYGVLQTGSGLKHAKLGRMRRSHSLAVKVQHSNESRACLEDHGT